MREKSRKTLFSIDLLLTERLKLLRTLTSNLKSWCIMTEWKFHVSLNIGIDFAARKWKFRELSSQKNFFCCPRNMFLKIEYRESWFSEERKNHCWGNWEYFFSFWISVRQRQLFHRFQSESIFQWVNVGWRMKTTINPIFMMQSTSVCCVVRWAMMSKVIWIRNDERAEGGKETI